MKELPPRNKSQRIKNKKDKENEFDKARKFYKGIQNPKVTDICPGLNEFTDALDAFPSQIISYFTLLKEIDAKCVNTMPYLKAYITRFLQMKKDHPKRPALLLRIGDCLKDLMPCLEEKMHVATIASDNVTKHTKRIEQSFSLIVANEIPEEIRIGPMWEPCMKVNEPKTLQQQRSESRREAMAARKGKGGTEDEYDSHFEDSPAPSTRKPKRTNGVNGEDKTTTVNSRGKRKSDDEFSTKPANKRVKPTKPKKELKKEEIVTRAPRRAASNSVAALEIKNAVIQHEDFEEADQEGGSEPLYCYCQQVSYGEMVGCDGDACEREWFHLPCTGLTELPKGSWYCDDCKSKS